VRSTVELPERRYALHPAFGEAEILELGADLRRPSRQSAAVRARPRALLVNGLYRHGFLLAPAMARQAADLRWRVTMRIFVNGDQREIEPARWRCARRAGLWRQEDRDRGERPLRAARRAPRDELSDGDKIEVVAPMQGG
jgi:hypothetical protein